MIFLDEEAYVTKVAIVILNYNTFDDTLVCVDSIKKFTTGVSYKIYIIDNASPDMSGEQLVIRYKDDPDVKVLVSEKNRGFSGGNNIGIRAALEEGLQYVYLLNSDVILENDAVSLMQEKLELNDDVAIVGPSIINSRGEYAQFARPGVTLMSYFMCRRLIFMLCPRLGKGLRHYEFSHNEDFVFDGMLNGCCFGLKSSFIQEHECLDENVFMYYEEDILAHIMKKTGKKSFVVSKAKIIHNEGIATKNSSENRLLFTRLYRWTSVLYVLKKYAGVSLFICKMISLLNVIEWWVLSLRNPAYKETLAKFISENRRVLK